MASIKSDGIVDIKQCERCDREFEADGPTQYIRDKRKYCSPECRRAASVDQRRIRSNRLIIPVTENQLAEELADDYATDKTAIVLVAIKLLDKAARQGKVNPAALAVKWGFV